MAFVTYGVTCCNYSLIISLHPIFPGRAKIHQLIIIWSNIHTSLLSVRHTVHWSAPPKPAVSNSYKVPYTPLVHVGRLPRLVAWPSTLADMKRSNSAPMIPEMIETVELKPPTVNSLFSRRGLSTSNVSLPGDIVRPELSPRRQVSSD